LKHEHLQTHLESATIRQNKSSK